jgi:hypothetical protein
MKKTDCSVVKDLLPLYIDDVCSPESKEIVDEHLKQCRECTAEKAKMTGEIDLPKDTGLKALMNIQITLSKKVKRRFVVLGAALLVVIFGVVIGIFLTSYQIPVAYEDFDGDFVIQNQGDDVTVYAMTYDYYHLYESNLEYLGDDEDGMGMYAKYVGYTTTPLIEMRKKISKFSEDLGLEDFHDYCYQTSWLWSTKNGTPEEYLQPLGYRVRITAVYYLPMKNNGPLPADKSDAILIWSEE